MAVDIFITTNTTENVARCKYFGMTAKKENYMRN